jgi:hypothetical protein
MFLLAHQLRVLFLLRLPPALSGSTAFPDFARLGLLRFFGVLAVDLDEDFFDARVGVGVDKVGNRSVRPRRYRKRRMVSSSFDALKPSCFLP